MLVEFPALCAVEAVLQYSGFLYQKESLHEYILHPQKVYFRSQYLHIDFPPWEYRYSFAEIRYVCDEYSISPQMVAKRAEQKHIISHSAYQQLLLQKSEMQGFALPQERPTRLEQMVQRALADGEINEARVPELLNAWQ